MKNSLVVKIFSLILALSVAPLASSFVVGDTWDGASTGADALWSNPLNWASDANVSGAGDTATFDNAGNGKTPPGLDGGGRAVDKNARFAIYEDDNETYDYEKGAYATIPIRWDEKKQTLTIGARKGGFPEMLKERTFRIVWVSGDRGAGIASTEKADVEVKYSGTEITVPRS
jgi:hypothetical protein